MACCVLSAGLIRSHIFKNQRFNWLCESLDSVLCCLNHRVQCHNGIGAAPWIINFWEGNDGL
jgi:hypothetical protein